MTFLIADDNAAMRESIRRFLQRNIPNDHTFIEAANGNEAVTLFEEQAVDWVLLDIEMEPVDGLTALKRIHSSHPTAKIIMVSSYDDVQYRQAAKEAGAIAYVLKTDLNKLESIISPGSEVG